MACPNLTSGRFFILFLLIIGLILSMGKTVYEMMERITKIIILIGDYTAQIGDPTGKDKKRKVLTEKEVKKITIEGIDTVQYKQENVNVHFGFKKIGQSV